MFSGRIIFRRYYNNSTSCYEIKVVAVSKSV